VKRQEFLIILIIDLNKTNTFKRDKKNRKIS